MDNLIVLFLGIWLGYELKRIKDNPHQQPQTTTQYLTYVGQTVEPKSKWCLMCEEPARAGDYFCSDKCAKKASELKRMEA